VQIHWGRENGLARRMTYLEGTTFPGRHVQARQMTKTVLVVEDNELNMKLFHDLLDAHGYRTLQTRSGMDALRIAREQRPDLILMDIQLPEVSGLEVTKWLRTTKRSETFPLLP
jgi:two-component system cell cycle response regulator DivK